MALCRMHRWLPLAGAFDAGRLEDLVCSTGYSSQLPWPCQALPGLAIVAVTVTLVKRDVGRVAIARFGHMRGFDESQSLLLSLFSSRCGSPMKDFGGHAARE